MEARWVCVWHFQLRKVRHHIYEPFQFKARHIGNVNGGDDEFCKQINIGTAQGQQESLCGVYRVYMCSKITYLCVCVCVI